MNSQLNLEDPKVLQAIEFSVESRMNLESDEQCTIIASKEIIQGIKIAIAKQQIFKDIYNRLVFQENPSEIEPYSITIVPDHLIEEAIQEQIKDHLSNNQDTQEKLQALNESMANIDEDTLNRISQLPESELTTEELKLKVEIQSKMIEVGMNVDLMFSDQARKQAHSDAIDSVFEKVVDQNTTITLKGLVDEEK